jgi:excinuclease ABC subunit B
MAVLDNPTARDVMSAQTKGLKGRNASSPSPLGGEGGRAQRGRERGASTDRPHKPHLDEMGIATWHEMKPSRDAKSKPRKPSLDEMGPGVESVPARNEGPRSKLGRPGQHGGFRANKRR